MRLVAAVSLIASFAIAQDPNLITNGGFEIGPGTSSNITLYSPSTALTGWTVFTGSVDQVHEWTVDEGQYAVDLDGLSAGGLRQIINTQVGATYVLSFLMAGNVDGTIKRMQVTAGAQQQVFSFDTAGHSGSSMGWTRMEMLFVASGASTTIEFLSLSAPSSSVGPALDDVQVHEPSFVNFGSGCLGSNGTPSVLRLHAPRVGAMYGVVVLDVPINQFGFAIIAWESTSIAYPSAMVDLTPYGMPTCNLYGLPDIVLPIASTGGVGAIVWEQALPSDPGIVGVPFVTQFGFVDPAANATGLITSDAVFGTIGT
jgi:choice-of-anchor C domain-containing protein